MYDKRKDKILKSWRITVTDKQTAVISLRQYAGGKPRLQIGVMEIKKENGEVIFGKLKRWGWDELQELRGVIDQALEVIDDLAANRSGKTK